MSCTEGIFTALGSSLSLYNFFWNRKKVVDFFAEVKFIKKDDQRIDGGDEELKIYLVNRGCPITLLDIYFDEGSDSFKIHTDMLPVMLNRGEVLKIPDKNLPFPVNREKISDKNIRFYVIDSFKNEYAMKRIFRKAHPTQPQVSKTDA